MHMVDTLDAGGLERVAVNIVNLLPRERYSPHLCTTRREGILAENIASDVGRIALHRRRRIDPAPLAQLIRYNKKHRIQILHAHGTALLVAVMARMMPPFPKVVWHDHYGAQECDERATLPYWLLARGIDAVISVSESLAVWSKRKLGLPGKAVHYVQNFVDEPAICESLQVLPGPPEKRLVCVANFRRQKDHITLLKAMALVVVQEPRAHLLLIGAEVDPACQASALAETARLGLTDNVHFLGVRKDVGVVLRHCAVGVLSSVSEGLPLALLEYATAGLPTVATNVGQCSTVVKDGASGFLVNPRRPELLADRILRCLRNSALASEMGRQLRSDILRNFGSVVVIGKICNIYDDVLHCQFART